MIFFLIFDTHFQSSSNYFKTGLVGQIYLMQIIIYNYTLRDKQYEDTFVWGFFARMVTFTR